MPCGEFKYRYWFFADTPNIAWIVSVIWKVAKKFSQRKLEDWEILYTLQKGEKVHNFYTFLLITFL